MVLSHRKRRVLFREIGHGSTYTRDLIQSRNLTFSLIDTLHQVIRRPIKYFYSRFNFPKISMARHLV